MDQATKSFDLEAEESSRLYNRVSQVSEVTD